LKNLGENLQSTLDIRTDLITTKYKVCKRLYNIEGWEC
jgi:hypothetical protein